MGGSMASFGIITSSDLGARGQREDTSGQHIQEMLVAAGFEFRCYEVLPDERDVLEDRLRRWADDEGAEPDQDHWWHRPGLTGCDTGSDACRYRS